MKFPNPKPGLVVRYNFLWSHEKDKGAEEGSKDRPCAIIVASSRDEKGNINVTLAPITHSLPNEPEDSIEIPTSVCKMLGLDNQRNYLRLDELNRFAWPGYDLRPIPSKNGNCDYGMLPKALYEELKNGILARNKAKKLRQINRD